jgi:hypothetical protein
MYMIWKLQQKLKGLKKTLFSRTYKHYGLQNSKP